MKVLLVRPISETHIISPPLGLGYLATALRKHNHQVEILDCVKEGMDFKEWARFIGDAEPEALGFQVWSCDIPFVRKSLQIARQVNSSIITIVGGAHPSGAPYRVREHLGDVDFAFRGEGEVGLPRLIDCLSGRKKTDFSEIPGLIWREHGKTKVNAPIFIDDLDRFGLPAWDLMDPGKYPQAPHEGFARAFPIAPIIVSRGCPYPCTFCATRTLTGRKIRLRSLDSVVEEIKLLQGKYGVREIHIEDDNFTADKHFVESFCQRLIDEKINIHWFCSSGVRLDLLDSHMLEMMKKAGCYNVTIAIESGVERVLKKMKKGLSLRQVERAVEMLNKCGFEPIGLFMLGFPGETKEDMEETIRFSLRLKLKRAQFAIFHPLPGTEIYEELKGRGELKELDWRNIRPSRVAYVPPGLTAKQIKSFQRKAFLKFHLRPRILAKQFKEVQSLSHLLFLIRRVFDYVKPG